MKLCIFLLAAVSLALNLSAQESPGTEKRTTIDSDFSEMQGTEERNFFYFRGNVHVRGTDLEIRCDELTVTSLRKQGSGDDTLGQLGAIEKIVAVGNVKIEQAGRQAHAGRVEVDPSAGTIHFLESPVLIQQGNEARAYGFVFYTNEKRFETVNPPGFVPGQATGRTVVTIDTADSLSSLVPEQDVTVGTGLNRTSEEPDEQERTAEAPQNTEAEAEDE